MNLKLDLDEGAPPIRFLIRDRDTRFSRSFDQIFRSMGAKVILAPIRVPNANAFAERAIETIRAECLDLTLVLGRQHLDRLSARDVRRRDLLAGRIHEYLGAAA